MKKITIEILISAGACFEQVRRFERAYPKGCEVCWMCFQEAKNKKGLPVAWLRNVLYPGTKGYHQRCAFAAKYLRCRNYGSSYILPEGLQVLERGLLRAPIPKPDKQRIAYYKRWIGCQGGRN